MGILEYPIFYLTHQYLQPNGFGATSEYDMKGYIHAKTSRAKLPAVGINNFSAYVTSLLNEMSSHQIVSSYTIYDMGLDMQFIWFYKLLFHMV